MAPHHYIEMVQSKLLIIYHHDAWHMLVVKFAGSQVKRRTIQLIKQQRAIVNFVAFNFSVKDNKISLHKR